MLRIYVSSTYSDLVEERRAAKDALFSLGHFPVGMEEYAASDERPLDRCLSDVRSCQGYVGIIAWKYGFRPGGGQKSITQLEYEEAEKHRIPCYIFLLHDDAPWPRARVPDEDQPLIKAFREILRSQRLISHFQDTSGLALAVTQSLVAAVSSGANTPSIPDMLPYLCDRSDQEYELHALVHSETRTDRPLLCLVHGEETEAHDKFLERLQRVMLPQLLPRQTERAGVRSYQLEWPSRFRTPQEMQSRLILSLSKEVLDNVVGTCEMISARIGENLGPVVVHSHVITENWQQERLRGLDAFIELWQGWPDLAIGQKLFVFLFIKYQGNKSFGPHKLRQYRRVNREIREALSQRDFSCFGRVTTAVLTELKGPTLAETQDWARSEEVGKFCDRQALVTATGEYYAQWARENPKIIPTRIPTEELAPRLREMISRMQLVRKRMA
jgi:Domain of unknown function (DUF4062)/inactive STAND